MVGLKEGGSFQNFENGALIASPATGIRLSTGKTRDAWAATGFEWGKLGYPTTDNYTTADGSVVRDYQGGRITVAADGTARIDYGVPSKP
ncbi:LGFP repeat-containing protein [Pseudarthrobacter sp. TAF60_1]|uniref:LGFP repeat-containing protein n=1 Tax=Pseudarthrobacter sp. TAF60_1 TaxID=3233071 RepID=UPI003F9C6C1A